MKKITLLLAFAMLFSFAKAQTAEEIADNYIDAIGGYEALSNLKGIKINAKVNSNIGELPLTVINTKDGKQFVSIVIQGREVVQTAFNGETAWNHNFMNMQAEKTDQETTDNLKRESRDFPNSFIGYKEKGYSIELLGKENFEGTECFKIKLTRDPLTVDGKEVENVSYYLFDTESFVPLAMETEAHFGPAKGNTTQIVFSDYQEVEGIYFPFTMSQGIKGQPLQPLNVESIELNPEIDMSMFDFPEEAAVQGEQ